MIIRMQGGGAIINFNQVTVLSLNKRVDAWEIVACFPYCVNNEAGHIPLAAYSTEEKAVKVLDMIQEMYEKNLYSEGGLMATANFYVPPFAFIPPKVFQMPEDSEV